MTKKKLLRHKVLLIVGTRPNLVKAAPVCKALNEAGCFEPLIVHTGQHYDAALSADFFKELSLPHPAHSLGVGSGRQAWQLGEMIIGIDKVIEQEKPDAILVFGDTNSTAAGAIAAAKNNIPLGHVEAGLRAFDKSLPEELNKVLITAVAGLHFCPTPTAMRNLAAEGIFRHVYLTGDVGIDLIHINLEKIEANRGALLTAGVQAGRYFFFTCHRAINTDNPVNLGQILSVLEELPCPVIFPIHPRTENAIRSHGLPNPTRFPLVRIVRPLGFFDTQTLIRNAKAVISDSGGVIKEAYYHRTPGIIIDKQTEWVETVDEGWNHVAGPNRKRILELSHQIGPANTHSKCLGDGTASSKIATILGSFLQARKNLVASEGAIQAVL